MRYKLDFFKNVYYAVPVDIWDKWQEYKQKGNWQAVLRSLWVIDNLNDFTFTDPQIQ